MPEEVWAAARGTRRGRARPLVVTITGINAWNRVMIAAGDGAAAHDDPRRVLRLEDGELRRVVDPLKHPLTSPGGARR